VKGKQTRVFVFFLLTVNFTDILVI